MDLWRVYTQTEGDESVTERLVCAKDKKEAADKAINNVKAQNLGRGDTSQQQSKFNTSVLAVKKCGKDGVLCTSRFPVAVIDALKGKKK